MDLNLLKEERRVRLLEEKLIKFLNKNSNDNGMNLGNDTVYCIASNNKVSIDDDILVNEYLNMKENAIDFINTYVAKMFDDGVFFGQVTNYKDDLWHVEYNDGDEEDFDVTKLKKGIQVYNSVKKNDSCITSENTVKT